MFYMLPLRHRSIALEFCSCCFRCSCSCSCSCSCPCSCPCCGSCRGPAWEVLCEREQMICVLGGGLAVRSRSTPALYPACTRLMHRSVVPSVSAALPPPLRASVRNSVTSLIQSAFPSVGMSLRVFLVIRHFLVPSSIPFASP